LLQRTTRGRSMTARPQGVGEYLSESSDRLVIGSGRTVQLNLIGPADRVDLLKGFEGLSNRSRYLRFFSAMPSLPVFIVDGLLDANRVAVGARLTDSAGRVEPALVGVARYFRADSKSAVAEPALAVVDALQGFGFGKLLLRRLSRIARREGVTHFRAHTLAGNVQVRRMLRDADGEIVEHDGPGLVYCIDLHRLARRRGLMRRLLKATFGRH
jgi:GNAT superfamily N-acetyltransferase